MVYSQQRSMIRVKSGSTHSRARNLVLRSCVAGALVFAVIGVAPSAQDASEAGRRQRYDEVLDTYVRDGLVYYRALKSDRAKLDSYVTSLGTVSLETASPREQV